jgi:hypothetical protein
MPVTTTAAAEIHRPATDELRAVGRSKLENAIVRRKQ